VAAFVAVKQEIGCLSVTFCSIGLLLAGILLSDGCQSGHLPFKLSKWRVGSEKMVVIREGGLFSFFSPPTAASRVIIECDNGRGGCNTFRCDQTDDVPFE
jgi:hypothetical protein